MSQAWVKIADLPEGADVGAIAASSEGYGLVGIGVSGDGDDVSEGLRRSRASILRATPDGVVQAYEGAGWIVGLDGSGPVWFAVGAMLQRGRGGSDYRLLRSLDGGRRWEDRGPVGARSVKSVLAIDEQVAWVHGATVLAATADGGKSWSAIPAPGERDQTRERLRRDRGAAVLVCDGQVLVFASGGATFEKHELPGESAWDVADGRVLLTSDAGDMTIASLDAQAAAAPVTVPKKGRLGLRLVAEGSLLRVLSRGADPAEGARMMLHRSEDAGRSWLHANLAVSSRCDIAGPSSGIGADVAGGLYVPRQ